LAAICACNTHRSLSWHPPAVMAGRYCGRAKIRATAGTAHRLSKRRKYGAYPANPP